MKLKAIEKIIAKSTAKSSKKQQKGKVTKSNILFLHQLS